MQNESKFKLLPGIFVYVTVLMLFCAYSSPLLNVIGIDSSVFRVMGRAMCEGKIMYRDVFDHKGFYIYVLNALAVLMTGKSMAGIFIVECVFMLLCAVTVYAVLSVYADEKRSFIGTQIFLMFALLHGTWEGGNLTEEYGLLFQIFAVYLLVKDDGKFSCLYMFLQGVCAGIVICLRPNIVMMWAGIALIAGYEMISQKKFGRLAGNIAAGIAGVAAGIAPAVVYAVMTDSISDMMFGTFGYNFMYTTNGRPAIYFPFQIAWRLILLIKPEDSSATILMFIIAASFVFVLKKRRDFPFSKYYFAMLIMAVFSTALPGRMAGHYYVSLVPFCIPFAYFAASLVGEGKRRYISVILCLFSVLYCARWPQIANTFSGSRVGNLEAFVKCNEPYYSKDERVLVTNIYARLYNELGVIPQEKYFYIPANYYSAFPDPIDSQTASILSGVNDVIFSVNRKGESDIYPETGKSSEIRGVLENQYDLLHSENTGYFEITMYGKKRGQ